MLDHDKYYIPTKFIYDKLLSQIPTLSKYSDYKMPNGKLSPVFKPIKNSTYMRSRRQIFTGDKEVYQQWLINSCLPPDQLPEPLSPESFTLSCLYLYIGKDNGGAGVLTWRKEEGFIMIGSKQFNCTYYPVSNWEFVISPLSRSDMIRKVKGFKEVAEYEYSVF